MASAADSSTEASAAGSDTGPSTTDDNPSTDPTSSTSTSSSTTADGASGDSSTTSGPVDVCDAVVFNPPAETRAFVEVFDLYIPPAQDTPPIPWSIAFNECSPDDLFRGNGLARGYTAGDHTLYVDVDQVPLDPESLSSEPGDASWFALDEEQPPRLWRHDGILDYDGAGWRVSLMNMTGGDLDIYRVVDPDAQPREYELLQAAVPHGDTFEGDVPATADQGAWIRVDRAGQTLMEDNVAFVLPCLAGDWPTEAGQIFWLFRDWGDDVFGPSDAVTYFECASSSALSAGTPPSRWHGGADLVLERLR